MAEQRGNRKAKPGATVTVTKDVLAQELVQLKAGERLTALWRTGTGAATVVTCRRESDGALVRVPNSLLDWA